ncbi:MAG: hypothetical protein H7Z43_08610 [Clostridia bacterium]|nr:hypothetical protein [Deltaproteobacteria bacterium]
MYVSENSSDETKAQVLDAVNERVSDIKERFGTVDTRLRSAARERPLLVVAGALTLGYIFARIVSR